MQPQLTDYNCGPASMAAAAHALGRQVRQGAFAKAAGTTTAGSDEEDIMRGLLAKGFVPEEFGFESPREARSFLRVQLLGGLPVILSVQRHSHWVCAVGVLGTRFNVFDPGRYEYRQHSGIAVFPWDKLYRYWRGSRKQPGARYYGIVVHPSNA